MVLASAPLIVAGRSPACRQARSGGGQSHAFAAPCVRHDEHATERVHPESHDALLAEMLVANGQGT
jgi:hypothetical protein